MTRDFVLEADELEILKLLCESLDRCDEARLEIEKHGLMVEDRFGQLRTNPAAAVERDAAIRASRLWRELDLQHELAQPQLTLKTRK